MSRFSVAHVLSSFGMGGQERVALDLALGQRAAGCRVMAVSLAPGADAPLAGEFLKGDVAVHTIAKRPGFDPTLFYRLSRFFRNQEIQVVHTHNPQPLIYGIPAARIAGALAIHTKHGANPGGGRRLVLRRAAAALTHAFVAVSATTAEVARSGHEVSEAKLHTIANGIDLSRFFPDSQTRAAVREELGISQGARLVGTVGRLAPEKAQSLLIAAMAPLLNAQTHLLIVGDGAESAALRSAAAALPVAPYVHFTGARHDVPRLLAALDVFALSSHTEGLPLVICEAMATALPIVSTAVGGIPDVIDQGRTGLLVPPNDAGALGSALATLLSDPIRAATMGAEAREVALGRYSAQRMVRDYLALYGSLFEQIRAAS